VVVGAEVCLYACVQAACRNGSAKSWDHCELIHEIWFHALINQTYIWLERVASKDNIADLPSREKYGLMRELGCVWRPPAMALHYVDLSSEFALRD